MVHWVGGPVIFQIVCHCGQRLLENGQSPLGSFVVLHRLLLCQFFQNLDVDEVKYAPQEGLVVRLRGHGQHKRGDFHDNAACRAPYILVRYRSTLVQNLVCSLQLCEQRVEHLDLAVGSERRLHVYVLVRARALFLDPDVRRAHLRRICIV